MFGFFMAFVLTFSKVILSLFNKTNEYRINCLIAIRLGMEILMVLLLERNRDLMSEIYP